VSRSSCIGELGLDRRLPKDATALIIQVAVNSTIGLEVHRALDHSCAESLYLARQLLVFDHR
jgi:hypothetical protein